MKEVIVSVIIPVFNTREYLKRCIDSILNQTLKSVEIIVVDDASTQNIKEFLDAEYPNTDNLIYIRNETRQRPGGARNRGLEIAKGKYISFIDSDDWLDLNLYENVLSYMESENADIGMVSMIREEDCPKSTPIFKCQYKQLYTLDSDIALRILSGQYDTGIRIVPACINKIYHANFLKAVCARFEEDIYFQGILFCVYTFLRASRIICVPDVKYHHYLRLNSVTQSFDEKHIHDFFTCFQRMKQYFLDIDLYEKYCFNYHKICEHYLNVVVSEIFEYIPEEALKKQYLRQVLKVYQELLDFDEYFNYVSAEELRQHIQPQIQDPFTILY